MENKRKNLKILILSAPIGSGHRLAAEALKEYLESCPGVEVEHGNVFNFFPGLLGKAFLKTYLKILDLCPWMYELAYRWGNRGGGSLWLRALINRCLALLGRNYILGQNPDAVIATHATPAGIVSYLRPSKPFWRGCVITDYTVHRWWLVDGVDAYFTAAPELKEKLPGAKAVLPYGIPLRQQFAAMEGHRKPEADKSVRTCLLLGGGEGLLPMKEIIAALSQPWQDRLRIIAVTGHNQKLKQILEENFAEAIQQGRLEVLGFSRELPRLMQEADLVITKAGGLSTAELLACGVDFVIYKPLPGQEENNARFLQEHFGASSAQDVQALQQLISRWLEQPQAENKPYYGKPLATRQIGDYILQQLGYAQTVREK